MEKKSGIPVEYLGAYTGSARIAGSHNTFPQMELRVASMILPILRTNNERFEDTEEGLRIFDPVQYSKFSGLTFAKEVRFYTPNTNLLSFNLNAPNAVTVDLRNVRIPFAGGDAVFGGSRARKVIMCDLGEIGDDFLIGRTHLESIDFSHTKSLRVIGFSFLLRCDGLRELDLRSLQALTSIGSRFLYQCASLRRIDLDLPNVARIDHSFMTGCSALESISAVTLKLQQQMWEGLVAGVSL